MYLEIKLKNKKYTTGKINLFLTKEALKLQKEALEFAESAMGIQKMENVEENLDEISKIYDKVIEVQDRKIWLLCEVFGNQFKADDIEEELSTADLDKHVNEIIGAITGVVGKN